MLNEAAEPGIVEVAEKTKAIRNGRNEREPN